MSGKTMVPHAKTKVEKKKRNIIRTVEYEIQKVFLKGGTCLLLLLLM